MIWQFLNTLSDGNGSPKHRCHWVWADIYAEVLKADRASAGVSGLTTALLLSRTAHYQITVAARHMPGDYDIDYASPWAGADYIPYVCQIYRKVRRGSERQADFQKPEPTGPNGRAKLGHTCETWPEINQKLAYTSSVSFQRTQTRHVTSRI